jgi:hypothetical protein
MWRVDRGQLKWAPGARGRGVGASGRALLRPATDQPAPGRCPRSSAPVGSGWQKILVALGVAGRVQGVGTRTSPAPARSQGPLPRRRPALDGPPRTPPQARRAPRRAPRRRRRAAAPAPRGPCSRSALFFPPAVRFPRADRRAARARHPAAPPSPRPARGAAPPAPSPLAPPLPPAPPRCRPLQAGGRRLQAAAAGARRRRGAAQVAKATGAQVGRAARAGGRGLGRLRPARPSGGVGRRARQPAGWARARQHAVRKGRRHGRGGRDGSSEGAARRLGCTSGRGGAFDPGEGDDGWTRTQAGGGARPRRWRARHVSVLTVSET